MIKIINLLLMHKIDYLMDRESIDELAIFIGKFE